METDELKDLVFAENSTLIQTLSGLDVTDIAGIQLQVTDNTNELVLQKQQLDTLGQKQFQDQAFNNQQFVLINTQLLAMQEQVDLIPGLSEQVTNLDNEISAIDLRVDGIDEEVSEAVVNIDILQTQMASTIERVDYLLATVNDMKDVLTSLVSQVSTLQGQVTTLQEDSQSQQNQIDAINNTIRDLEATDLNLQSQIDNQQAQIVINKRDADATAFTVLGITQGNLVYPNGKYVYVPVQRTDENDSDYVLSGRAPNILLRSVGSEGNARLATEISGQYADGPYLIQPR